MLNLVNIEHKGRQTFCLQIIKSTKHYSLKNYEHDLILIRFRLKLPITIIQLSWAQMGLVGRR